MTKNRGSVLLWAASLLTCLCSIDAAHSRRRPVVVRRDVEPRYDRSITTFSTDGRLQQVEYGLEASRRGDPVVAMSSNNVTCIAVRSPEKVHRLDAHVLLVTAGLMGDGRALASALRTACQRSRLATGEAPRPIEVARMAAKMQHDLTRMGGARPLGCTAILVGVDNGVLRLYQTDPGGIMEEYHYCAAGKGRDKSMSSLQKLADELESDSRQDVAPDLIRISQQVSQVALDALDEKEADSAQVDVWILEADASCRGGINLKCIRKVKRRDMNRLKDLLTTKNVLSTKDA